jgi:hypothetical protein
MRMAKTRERFPHHSEPELLVDDGPDLARPAIEVRSRRVCRAAVTSGRGQLHGRLASGDSADDPSVQIRVVRRNVELPPVGLTFRLIEWSASVERPLPGCVAICAFDQFALRCVLSTVAHARRTSAELCRTRLAVREPGQRQGGWDQSRQPPPARTQPSRVRSL